MPTLVSPSAPHRCVRCLRAFSPANPSRRLVSSSAVRPLAQSRQGILNEPWQQSPAAPTFFSQTRVQPSLTDGLEGDPKNEHKPPDERILKLGKTLRTLSPLLPTLLINPLPPHILSPSVALHLFPSTHPHLPTVKGRTLYRAALWTVPVAWSSLPIVGNVKLQILGERMVRAGTVLDPERHGDSDSGEERLVVRWKTERRGEAHSPSATTPPTFNPNTTTTSSSQSPQRHGINKGLSVLLGGDAPIFKLSHEQQFTGLFIFSFDEEGRIQSHTIEHADDACGWERTAKFVTLTDWLIGKARGSLDPPVREPGLAMHACHEFRDSSYGDIRHHSP